MIRLLYWIQEKLFEYMILQEVINNNNLLGDYNVN
jgi:hypothetical protein